ncbi:hypothetical protein HII28_11105 [Planctomonas sp. JC2975]|uniref:hypothetical protein n=1 Tax=Planctomonas sp. JC2975 TaxID=2729626 RepID=UPI00147334D4|nr:hypothetical protein [Planctomonas sp. JC2975]NNC12422.1 hypothetical protein [Planctomonas sp. JC2975]
MWARGYLEPDRPAPPSLDEWAALMPVPVLGFVPQPHLDELGGSNASGTSNGIVYERTVRVSYTLWRIPEDREDPRNLADLPDDLQRALDTSPPVELPDWVMEARRRAHYPSLWDAVSTAWYSPERADARPTLEHELVRHVNYILINRHPEPTDVDGDGIPRPEAWDRVADSHVEHGVEVQVNGRAVDGIRIDTDPYVYALGADLGDRMLTVVVDRDDLQYLRLAFADR